MKKRLWLFKISVMAVGATFLSSCDADPECVVGETVCKDGVLYTCIVHIPADIKAEPCGNKRCENDLKCQAPVK